MEHFNIRIAAGHRPTFQTLPERNRRRIFGIDYAHLVGKQLGEFFLTRAGWSIIDSLLPEHWFTGKIFSKVGRALAGATGAVYRVPVPHKARSDFALVVKFSRFCQSVGIAAMEEGEGAVDPARLERIRGAQFLAPFEEFANVRQLSRQSRGQLLVQQPLGIYCPPTRYLDYQLGRQSFLKSFHQHNLRKHQPDTPDDQKIRYDWERQYILLYGWMRGTDLEQANASGQLPQSEMIRLGRVASQRMADAGWEVLDHKPRHVIIRFDNKGKPLRFHRQSPLAIVDYELLYRYRSPESPKALA